MNLEKLKHIKRLLGNEISDSLNEVGTKNMKLLCELDNTLSILLKRLQNPEKTKELDRKEESKIWRD